ncbi:prepilin-type N-terminal cleavage/methylation domain-containing protein [Lentisphaera profundi]|uniref:Prepilin-type N-terminal cleavage/methylation domain-containing protein n=1 Tax=Lentisphaera profundi TaxID=1658616 RepID=A0ABY7VUG8_9BACT|nr:prepilin-type N-terminal cleavage/methylation domain-containing protein [Lentisphaera profundi]WDE96537.1 prepilin-type N-terminal cleavage/methylation domain-containing protein [Lentisphaera profundi]
MKNKMKSFTLIEVLVVIALLAILMSLLLPALGKARLKAKIAQCVNNEKQISTAVYMYSGDNEFYIPAHYTASDRRISFDDYLGMGYDGREISLNEAKAFKTSEAYKLYECPTDESHVTTSNHNRSYGGIQGNIGGNAAAKRGPIGEGSGLSKKFTQINYASDTIMFSEFHTAKNVLGGKSYGVFRVMDLQSSTTSGALTWSHGDFKFNHIFVDGSVRAISQVATYSGSGLDPWNDSSTINTMWDSMR